MCEINKVSNLVNHYKPYNSEEIYSHLPPPLPCSPTTRSLTVAAVVQQIPSNIPLVSAFPMFLCFSSLPPSSSSIGPIDTRESVVPAC